MKNIDRCPICQSPDIKFYYKGQSERVPGNWFDLSICDPCQHYFINPQPDWEELEPFYHSGYSQYSFRLNSEEMDSVIAKAKQTSSYRHIKVTPGTEVLDIGCGSGEFLYVLKNLGAVTQGIEPSKHGVKTAKEMGINVFHGDLTDYLEQVGDEKKFDVITANHVLEHHPNPAMMLAEMRKLLKPNGMIWLSVPNAGFYYAKALRDQWHSLDLPYHLMHFNTKSSAILVEKSGLKLKRLYTYSLESAITATFKSYLRKKFLIPIRVSEKLSFVIDPIARRVGKRLDRNDAGEALMIEVVAP